MQSSARTPSRGNRLSRADPKTRGLLLWTDPELDPLESVAAAASVAREGGDVDVTATAVPLDVPTTAAVADVATARAIKNVPRFLSAQPSLGKCFVQLYNTALDDAHVDVLFTFCFSGGTDSTDGNITPIPAAVGPLSASLSDTSNTRDAWKDVMTALQQGSAPRTFSGIGVPAVDVVTSFDSDNSRIRFENMPAPLPTAGTVVPMGYVQYVYVQIVGVSKAPLVAYFGASEDDAALQFAQLNYHLFSNGGSISSSPYASGDTYLMPPQEGTMVVYSPNADPVAAPASAACPPYAPFARGVCELNPNAIFPIRAPESCSSCSLAWTTILNVMLTLLFLSLLLWLIWGSTPKTDASRSADKTATSLSSIKRTATAATASAPRLGSGLDLSSASRHGGWMRSAYEPYEYSTSTSSAARKYD